MRSGPRRTGSGLPLCPDPLRHERGSDVPVDDLPIGGAGVGEAIACEARRGDARRGDALGEGDAGFVARQLGRVEDLSVAIDRHEVATGSRSSKGVGGTEQGDIIERSAGEREEGLERKTGRLGHPLYLTEEADEVVGGDTGGGVVRRPLLVGHDDRLTVEGKRELRRELVAGDGEEWAAPQAQRTDDGVGQRDQRVKRGPPRMRREDAEPERARTVKDHGCGNGIDGTRDLGHSSVRYGEQHGVHIRGSVSKIVETVQNPQYLDPRRSKSTLE